jgi:hypothetical protein
MRKLSRKEVYEQIKTAVAWGDEEKAIRIAVKNRISDKRLMRAIEAARDMRQAKLREKNHDY